MPQLQEQTKEQEEVKQLQEEANEQEEVKQPQEEAKEQEDEEEKLLLKDELKAEKAAKAEEAESKVLGLATIEEADEAGEDDEAHSESDSSDSESEEESEASLENSHQAADCIAPQESEESLENSRQADLSDTAVWSRNILGNPADLRRPLQKLSLAPTGSSRQRASSESSRGPSSRDPSFRTQLAEPKRFLAPEEVAVRMQELTGAEALVSLRSSAKELAREKLRQIRQGGDAFAPPLPAGPRPSEVSRFAPPAPPLNYRLGRAKSGYKASDAWEYDRIEKLSQKPSFSRKQAVKPGFAPYCGRLAPVKATGGPLGKSHSLPSISARGPHLGAQREAAQAMFHGSPQRMLDVR